MMAQWSPLRSSNRTVRPHRLEVAHLETLMFADSCVESEECSEFVYFMVYSAVLLVARPSDLGTTWKETAMSDLRSSLGICLDGIRGTKESLRIAGLQAEI
jgi:hypothetical protein